MSVLDEVGTYLAANVSDTTLTLGTNLFLGRLPDSPDTCVSLQETGGLAPVDTMSDNTAPVMERPTIQVLVRAVAYSDGRSLIKDCFDKANLVCNEDLSSVRYERIEAIQSPFPVYRDSQDRAVFSVNFICHKTIS
jgi:hypothetical protein